MKRLVGALVDPPRRIPLLLRPALWLARRITGKDPLPARLLSHATKAAVASGVLEALAAHAPRDLDARTLKLARLTASITAGCPFCIDMNSHEHAAAGITRDELAALLRKDFAHASFTERERAAIDLARGMSETPVRFDPALHERARTLFTPRELVMLTTASAQVNYWARLNQALGVPAAGFFFEEGSACDVLPQR